MKNTSNFLNYTTVDILTLLGSNPDGLERLFIEFSTRYIHIKQLGIERNTYLNWEKAGLIPYERIEGGWRKFSFVESVWIKMIQEMRSLGLSMAVVKEVKEILWPNNMDSFFDLIIEKFKTSTVEAQGTEELLLKLEKEGTAQLKKEMESIQFGYVMFFVIVSLIKKATYCFVINKDREINIVPLVSYTPDMDYNIVEMQMELFTASCTIINLWSIIQELSMNENVKLREDTFIGLLSPVEKRILDQIQQKGYSEIVIKNDNSGEPTHIKVKRIGFDEEAIKKLHPFLKKGAYRNIEFKTKNGQLISYEDTEVIKL